ncbi:MAG: AAA family ATPase [Micropruina sp.]|nr:AAA family ATPase [Micropruina sp.]
MFGESGCGKSWTLLVVSQQLLDADKQVLYIDYESNARKIIGRLINLGLQRDQLARFHYLRPDTKIDDKAYDHRMAELLTIAEKCELVVIDSVGEALSMEGHKPNEDDEVAKWFRRIPAVLATVGPAVVCLDHVTKTSDPSTLWPIGSQRKRAAIGGTAYRQNIEEPFSRNVTGYSVLLCAKDRDGSYAQRQKVAELHYESHGRFSLIASVTKQVNAEDAAKVKIMELLQSQGPMLKSALTTAAGGKRSAAVLYIAELQKSGHIRFERVGHGDLCHASMPYVLP